jgi:hypothetical protein
MPDDPFEEGCPDCGADAVTVEIGPANDEWEYCTECGWRP